MIGDQFWELEESLWTGGMEQYQDKLDRECVMVFPAPAGIMTAEASMEALRHAPRWNSVAFEEQSITRPSPDVIVLAYLARGEREGGGAYKAYCSSACRRERWLLFQHQQTPI